MMVDHNLLVGFSKSFGLFYLIAMFLVALAYALWPSNRQRFDRAATAILEDDEDRPCR
jgi:cytochrome c oxidase cbb3-type subunit 4